jgi:hypothetical protein
MNFLVPGMGMGSMALNQLLIVMDGIGDPPFMRRFLTGRLNTWLDVLYFVPAKIGKLRLRIPPAKPTPEQIYFIGATNVPLEQLDPALLRPGRMGRHVWFRSAARRSHGSRTGTARPASSRSVRSRSRTPSTTGARRRAGPTSVRRWSPSSRGWSTR